MFRELGDLKGQHGAGGLETVDCDTPDGCHTVVRFFEEFMFKEEPPPMQQSPRQASGGEAVKMRARSEENPMLCYRPIKSVL